MHPLLASRLKLVAPLVTAATLGLACCDRPDEKPVAYDDLGWKKGVYSLDGSPFTGVAIQSHSDGTTRGRWEFNNGVPHGKVIEFNEAGTKIAETHYREGLRHGENTYWDGSGEQIKFQVFDEGKLILDEHSGSLKESGENHDP